MGEMIGCFPWCVDSEFTVIFRPDSVLCNVFVHPRNVFYFPQDDGTLLVWSPVCANWCNTMEKHQPLPLMSFFFFLMGQWPSTEWILAVHIHSFSHKSAQTLCLCPWTFKDVAIHLAGGVSWKLLPSCLMARVGSSTNTVALVCLVYWCGHWCWPFH